MKCPSAGKRSHRSFTAIAKNRFRRFHDNTSVTKTCRYRSSVTGSPSDDYVNRDLSKPVADNTNGVPAVLLP